MRLHTGNLKQPHSEQVVCENEASKWTDLWNEGADYAITEADWNNRSMAPNPSEGYCPLIVQHLRAAIRAFPKGTARAADNRAVRAFDALSHDALNARISSSLLAASYHWDSLVTVVVSSCTE